MDFYATLKLLHVAAAILWVGGASVLTLLLAILLRRGDDEATMDGLSFMALMGGRVFAPVGLAAILSGLVLGWAGGWFWAAWTVLALGLVAGTFTLGATVLGPSTERAAQLRKERDLPAAMALCRRALRFAAIDLGAQWAIIALMVMKPGWADLSLALPAALILAGAVAALRGPAAPRAPQAA